MGERESENIAFSLGKGARQAVWMSRLVFEMQQLQGDVLATLAVAVHLQPVRLRPTRSQLLLAAVEQQRFMPHRRVFGQRPTQPSLPRTLEVALDVDALMPTLWPIRLYENPCALSRRTSPTWRMDNALRGT